jgi:hypothetical protein
MLSWMHNLGRVMNGCKNLNVVQSKQLIPKDSNVTPSNKFFVGLLLLEN